MQDYFVITRLHRDDLKAIGYDETEKISDITMKRIANKMENTYIENSYWIDLEIIADIAGIPKTEK